MPQRARLSISKLRDLAERLVLAGSLHAAVDLYREIVAAKPAAPDPRNRLADLLARTERNAEAVAVWRQTARLYEDGGLLPRAARVWRKIAHHSPDDPDSRAHLAALLRRQGHHQGAMTADADAAEIWARCGETEAAFQLVEPLVDSLLASGRPGAAAERLEQILSHDQSHPGVRSKLADVYNRMRRRPGSDRIDG
jgi:tetratricopeptide (TPR) repeat protein